MSSARPACRALFIVFSVDGTLGVTLALPAWFIEKQVLRVASPDQVRFFFQKIHLSERQLQQLGPTPRARLDVELPTGSCFTASSVICAAMYRQIVEETMGLNGVIDNYNGGHYVCGRHLQMLGYAMAASLSVC
jgi:hypothetical protein